MLSPEKQKQKEFKQKIEFYYKKKEVESDIDDKLDLSHNVDANEGSGNVSEPKSKNMKTVEMNSRNMPLKSLE